MIPLYFQVKALGVLNSVWGLMVGYLVMSFGIFLIRQNVIHSIPDELLEAARIDGAGNSGCSSISCCRCCGRRWQRLACWHFSRPGPPSPGR